MNTDPASKQREYYRDTSAKYDAMHVSDSDEHAVALAMFSGFARLVGTQTVLDVGAGTGRAFRLLERLLPAAEVIGIEPVPELREIGHKLGVPEDRLVEGDALALQFAEGSFDFVIETGMLHHIATPQAAIAEMLRVARHGVMISDCNKFGQGRWPLRLIKAVIGWLGLWHLMIWLTTRGKIAKFSEGDGIFYSYSVFDSIRQVRTKFPMIYMFNTVGMAGTSPKHGAAQVALIAVRPR